MIDLVSEGGLLVLDDFAPSSQWPRRYRGDVDQLRMTYLTHRHLNSVEVMVSAEEAVVLATRVSRQRIAYGWGGPPEGRPGGNR